MKIAIDISPRFPGYDLRWDILNIGRRDMLLKRARSLFQLLQGAFRRNRRSSAKGPPVSVPVKVSILVFLFFLLLSQTTLAASSYVLPYPGLMPGHKLYKIKQVFDQLYRFWAFGNFSRHQYELKLSDKKLVEAKVLFEYQQYLLASEALSDSNQHFQKAVVYLNEAEKEGKDISQKMINLKAAAEKHKETLLSLQKSLPEEFLWQPEKKEAQVLEIKKSLEEAVEKIDLINLISN